MKPLSICQLGHSAAVMSSSMPAGLLLPHTGNFYTATLYGDVYRTIRKKAVRGTISHSRFQFLKKKKRKNQLQ